ncbi:MAG: hypothetical protein AB1600_05685 [Bacteroidota bacterium]
MKHVTHWIFGLFVIVCCSNAQDVTVTASVDSQSIVIGDWIHYTVAVKHPASMNVALPLLKDTLGGFDIVQQDSVVKTEDNGVLHLQKKFVITKFDAGTQYIPPFTVRYATASGETLTAQSNAIPIEVRGIEVDTTQAIHDIKPPLSVPLSAEEIALYVAIVLAVAAAGYGIYYYLKKRRKTATVEEEKIPNIPPHVLALLQLDELEAKGLWQKGEVKAFYSEATDILRRYFERRYGILALEMTTGEVMEQLKKYSIDQKTVNDIERFLSDADLVKFAKYQPMALENEQVLPAARMIVENTKPVEPIAPESPESIEHKHVVGEHV